MHMHTCIPFSCHPSSNSLLKGWQNINVWETNSLFLFLQHPGKKKVRLFEEKVMSLVAGNDKIGMPEIAKLISQHFGQARWNLFTLLHSSLCFSIVELLLKFFLTLLGIMRSKKLNFNKWYGIDLYAHLFPNSSYWIKLW